MNDSEKWKLWVKFFIYKANFQFGWAKLVFLNASFQNFSRKPNPIKLGDSTILIQLLHSVCLVVVKSNIF